MNEESPAPEDNSASGVLAERLDRLERALGEQAARLRVIEEHLSGAALRQTERPASRASDASSQRAAQSDNPPIHRRPSPPAPIHNSPANDTAQATLSGTPHPFSRDDRSSTSTSDGAQDTAHGAAVKIGKTQGRTDLEMRIGGSWLNRIGIIAIAFGIAFFLKYAFDNEWIGPTARVAIGGAAGLVALIAGERLRARGYAQYAQSLSGGGILILYLAIFAAFAFYHLIAQLPAFLLMVLVTATAVLLAARANALLIAVLGLVGGFLTPALLSTGTDNEIGLFSYIALLDAGVLALAYFKGWRSLNYMAFAATALMIIGWMFTWYEAQKRWTTLFFLGLFFLIFAALSILQNTIKRRPSRGLDITLILFNALFYFSLSYGLLADGYERFQGSLAVLVSSFYMLLYYCAYRRNRNDALLSLTLFSLAVTFFTLAVAIQLDQQWVTIGWASEGALLVWISVRAENRTARLAALIVFGIAIAHWFSVDVSTFERGDQFLPLLNRRAVAGASLISALMVAAVYVNRQSGAEVEAKDGKQFGAAFALAANALAVTLLSLDVNDYFEQINSLNGAALEKTKQHTIIALWTLYGTIALAVGIKREWKLLRVAALVLLAAATLKLLLFVLTIDVGTASHTLIFNQTFASFALLISALLCANWFYKRAGRIEAIERAGIVPLLIVTVNALAIIALSIEAHNFFNARIGATGAAETQLRDTRLATQLALSVIWTMYGGALLIAGIVRHSKLLRIFGLILLGLTIFKVFLFDLASLDRFYRIISFIVLGAILLAVSFLYQQRQRQSKQGNSEE